MELRCGQAGPEPSRAYPAPPPAARAGGPERDAPVATRRHVGGVPLPRPQFREIAAIAFLVGRRPEPCGLAGSRGRGRVKRLLLSPDVLTPGPARRQDVAERFL